MLVSSFAKIRNFVFIAPVSHILSRKRSGTQFSKNQIFSRKSDKISCHENNFTNWSLCFTCFYCENFLFFVYFSNSIQFKSKAEPSEIVFFFCGLYGDSMNLRLACKCRLYLLHREKKTQVRKVAVMEPIKKTTKKGEPLTYLFNI